MKRLLRRSRDVDFADQGMGWHFFSISWVKNRRQECPKCPLSPAAGCYFEPCDMNIKNYFGFRFSLPTLLPFKNGKFYFQSCQKPRKGRPRHSHIVTSYQERSRCQNKLLGLHCRDLIHYVFLYSATTRLSTKLHVYETADVTSNLSSDLELLESFECESPTSEVESETELAIKKEAIQNQKILT